MTATPSGRLPGRFALMLGGEVLQSVFHFALNLVLVRVLVPHDYGLFAIVFLVGGICLTFVRAVAGVPTSIFVPQARRAGAVAAYCVTFGSGAVAVSLVLALGVAGPLVLTVGPASAAAGAAFVGAWCLRSYLRTLLFARRKAAVAAVSDLAFTTCGTVLGALLLVFGPADDLLPGSLAVLALANATGGVVGLLVLGDPLRLSLRRPVVRRYRRLLGSMAWSVTGVTIANVQAQGQTLLVALLAGPGAYAPIAATLVLFAPLRLPASVLVNMIQPEMATCLATGERTRLARLMAASTVLLATGCAVYGAVLAAGLPFIESHLFAGRFAGEPIGLIGALIWASVTLALLYAAPKTLLETRRSFRDLALVAAASAVVGIALVAILLRMSTPVWSLLGVVASELVILAACWWRAVPLGTDAPPHAPSALGTLRRPHHAAA